MEILVPVLKEVDVLIIGAILSGCELAVRLRKAGRRVTVTTSGYSLGDDVIGRLDRNALGNSTFLSANATEAQCQAQLDRLLLNAGAEFLFGAIPIRPLYATATHRLSGWIFFSKSGYFAITAKAVVDATNDGILPFQMRLNRRSSGISECVVQWNLIGDCTPPGNVPGASLEVSLPPVDADGTSTPFCQYRRSFRLRQNDALGLLRAETQLRADALTTKTQAAALWPKFKFFNSGWDGVVTSTELPLYRADALDVAILLRETIPAVTLPTTFLGVESRSEDTGFQLVWKSVHQRPPVHKARVSLSLDALSSEVQEKADVIIVGSGTACLAAARMASQKGLRVILLASHDIPSGTLDELVQSGIEMWFHTLIGGVLLQHHEVAGALIIVDDGTSFLVRTSLLIDGTDCAAIAAAAGAPMHYPQETEPITHSAVVAPRMPSNPFSDSSTPRDFHHDIFDATYSCVASHLCGDKGAVGLCHRGKHDRSRISSEITILPQDFLLHRRYKDTLAVSRGQVSFRQNSCHPLLWLEELHEQDAPVWVPLRAMLPLRIEGMLVLGEGTSIHKDILEAYCGEELLQREGIGAGLLAYHAIHDGISLRKHPLRPIQEELVNQELLPPEVLQTMEDTSPRQDCELAAVFNRPDQARRVLQAHFETTRDLQTATVLAFLGDSSGREVLSQELRQAAKRSDDREFCTLVSAFTTIGGTPTGILDKLQTLTIETPLPLFRAICLFLHRWPTRSATPKLRELWNDLAPQAPPLQENGLRNAVETVLQDALTLQIKTLYLAASLHACDPDESTVSKFLEYSKHSWHLLVAQLAHFASK